MATINVADVDVKYRAVEVPDSCPMCGNRLASKGAGRRPAVRELNLASANFFGAFGRPGDRDGFALDPDTPEEHPSEAIWVVFGYECTGCGELLATGDLSVC